MKSLIMGILNITPDSFYDGGKFNSFECAKNHIFKMIEEGVDIIDVGGFSSRPNSVMPTIEEELSRIIPVLDFLDTLNVDFCVDTCRDEVVKNIIKYKNLKYINDISGLSDERILDFITGTNIGYILMHTKGTPKDMQNNPEYKDVVKEIISFFDYKLKILEKSGIKNIILDPGFGFGKTVEHNYQILQNLNKFKKFGFPVLCGLSRKSMIYKPLFLTPKDVLNETIALNLLAISKGVNIIRVHDVKEHKNIIELSNYLKPKINSFYEALKSIFAFEIIKDYSLEKAKEAVIKLGNPQNNYKIIHIAGTNGKGSVSKMVFSILKKAGKKVGVFTSPHLIDIRERFETQDGLISKSKFVKILNKIISLGLELSYFEKCTLIALEYFKQEKCEYVVLEVGCGGRLDTTNIINPIITTITSIGLDHIHLLGDTIEKISYEKAGIIKTGVPIVLNFKNEIIEKKAKEMGSNIIFASKKVNTNLHGEHQEKNASLAYEIGKYLKIDEKAILNGLNQVKHRGRLEFVKNNLLVDGAHNESSIKALKLYIDTKLKNKFKRIFYCFALKKGKSIDLVFDIIGKSQNYILLDIKSDILEDFSNLKNTYSFMSKKQLLKEVKNNKCNLYVIFGSLYMIGEFLE